MRREDVDDRGQDQRRKSERPEQPALTGDPHDEQREQQPSDQVPEVVEQVDGRHALFDRPCGKVLHAGRARHDARCLLNDADGDRQSCTP